MNEQTVWITGASSGIGEALAKESSKRGARVILSGRNIAELDRVASECGETLVLPFETTDYDALPGLVARAWDWAAGIDLLINNAGISQRSLAEETEFAVYERIVAVDLLAPIALTQALLPRMVDRKSGRLAFISSIAGKVGVPMRSAYSAAKFGLLGYADALRAELSVHGIQVHGIAPGSIRTNVSRNALTSDGSERGFSDPAIEKGIDPTAAAVEMLDAIAAGQREIVVAHGAEKQMGELTRTPDALFDQVAALMARGYAQQLKAEH
ncbi:SDR family NAD(P)-dependent oxidoreductase [Novosphingobium sp. Gsoil 351]|uniref:SDR family NAD(P)-dependent oxidoreductase n=1 Tax=Novosphingobium sp. Gsoil 351 TaxID=2675225 RepID=UPI0012B4AF73|nr:SDR family NAD(P)-dependent oxidoreductase [Novosphingobium sp. Gsoil 351]QGN53265.1 SDR family NAD(P)-dependent oxidoreductase [Novosphingobium sp. Gsoil 351]